MDPSQPRPELLIRRYYGHFNARRFADAAAIIAPHASFRHGPTRQHVIGPAGYRMFAESWVRAFPDARVDIVALHMQKDGKIAVDLLGCGTHSGALDLGEVVFPPTDRRVELEFRQHFQIENGLIVDARLDFDLGSMQKLLAPDRG